VAIRVLLVDDAVVVRHILSDTLSKDPDIDIIGTAADGLIALEKIPVLKPQVVVLDVEMPNMDGIEALAVIRKKYPEIKVIMFSTLTSRGAAATMDALMLGAHDYVTKPANVGSVAAAIEQINKELAPRIKALVSRGLSAATAFNPPPAAATSVARPAVAPKPAASAAVPRTTAPPAVPTQSANRNTSTTPPIGVHTPRGNGKIQVIAIAVSTGGPNALAELLPKLPADLAAPIVIVQHIPAMFSKALADRLDTKSPLHVQEGIHGAELRAGDVWVAPGDFHMTVRKEGLVHRIETNQGPPENSCRPAADVLFRSVASVFGGSTLGVVLTGMGSDGAKGADVIVKAGGKVIAQDEASSVVWGMPGAVAQAGLVDGLYPLDRIAGEIIARVGTTTRPPAAVRTSVS
jgi:two-component system chemotaxis response regulator CheB